MEKKRSKLANLGEKGKQNIWKKGGPTPNPNGRPNGQKNYSTLYREALIKLGKMNNMEPAEIELEMISKGITLGRKGDYKFYKDVLDRLHGTPVQKNEHTGPDGGPLQIEGVDISIRKK